MRDVLSDFKLQTGYLKFRDDLGRKETWREAVSERVMAMHRTKFAQELEESPVLRDYVDFAEQAYLDKLVLGSQRALQFGGDPILRRNSKMYNCLTSYCDRVPFFRESMWWLLSGCGVGFSVLFQYIDRLPLLKMRTKGTKTYVVPDSIEGWADAVGVLLASYFAEGDDKFQEYYGYDIKFDFSLIRPKGAPISSGFKAPGPEPLRSAIDKLEVLLESRLNGNDYRLRPIDAYDIVMHSSNAVLAGGVRRSATICIFDKTDTEMLNAKTGNWMEENPQRSRSNNSVALLKSETTREEFMEIMRSVEQYGEPGFVWLDDLRIVYNPCVEIGMLPALQVYKVSKDADLSKPVAFEGIEWVSGWQGCNLTEISGSACKNADIFYRACKASAILGTLQAAYTNFEYVGSVTEQIFRKEALLGCSITGWMNNPHVLFNEEVLRRGAEIIREVNEEIAQIIGINPAARYTCSKPSGTAGIILKCASGMKLEESEQYIRYIQVNKDEYGVEHFKSLNPEMFEDCVWDEEGNSYSIGFAIENNSRALLKRDVYGVQHLDYVKKAMQWWVEPGTVIERCTIPELRHNISNTISVDDWGAVADYIYDNRQYFAGISLLHMSGSLEYNQAPNSEVYNASKLLETYGDGVLLASGLIVDGLDAFDGDLWAACRAVLNRGIELDGNRRQKWFKKDWIRRAKKFARNYFRRDLRTMTHCLKDVHRFYRFNTIKKTFKPISWEEYFEVAEGVDVGTLGAISCNGDVCTLNV